MYRKWMCYVLAIVGLMVVGRILIDGMNRKKVEVKRQMESTLPHMVAEEETRIRVLLKTTGYTQEVHTQVEVSASSGLIVTSAEESKVYGAGERVCISPENRWFEEGSIRIQPQKETDQICVHSLERSYGVPSYRGVLELYATAEGIALVNELTVEAYLYAVVPSEMPASYEMEALKAQAICARSYAYKKLESYAYPEYEAHVDDSVSFQVYGNAKEQKRTNQAVNATDGQCIWYCDQIVNAYYYSTSCGKTTTVEAWNTKKSKKNSYLESVSVCDESGKDYECELAWYRWRAVISRETLEHLIEWNQKVELGELQDITITKTGPGGVALQVVATGSQAEVTAETEHGIRRMFGGEGYTLEKQDGTTVSSQTLLPSAFITITHQGDTFLIDGGGYGHGIGMSQNGAHMMAKAGKTYKDILQFFYSGVEIRRVDSI